MAKVIVRIAVDIGVEADSERHISEVVDATFKHREEIGNFARVLIGQHVEAKLSTETLGGNTHRHCDIENEDWDGFCQTCDAYSRRQALSQV